MTDSFFFIKRILKVIAIDLGKALQESIVSEMLYEIPLCSWFLLPLLDLDARSLDL